MNRIKSLLLVVFLQFRCKSSTSADYMKRAKETKACVGPEIEGKEKVGIDRGCGICEWREREEDEQEQEPTGKSVCSLSSSDRVLNKFLGQICSANYCCIYCIPHSRTSSDAVGGWLWH